MVYKFEPDYAVAPGESLREVLEALHMSQKEFAERAEITVQSVSRIIMGDQPITYDTAIKLELVTPYSSKFWMNLEADYRSQLLKIQKKEQQRADLEWLKAVPLKELVERGYIEQSTDKTEMLMQVLKFYGVSSPAAWEKIWYNPKVAARKSRCFTAHPGATSAWIRMGELQAQEIKTQSYSREVFNKTLKTIRSMTIKNPSTYTKMIVEESAKAGVAVSFVPKMNKVPLNGAAKWLAPEKALIVVNIRGKREDIFWFSFFHEAAHILLHKKKELYIDNGQKENPEEIEADQYASDFLIPENYNEIILKAQRQADILRIAQELNISSAIVAGRYQHLTKRWTAFNGLIGKLKWTEN
ncbi:MAG: HigA family addiction module antidote protein [Candidatus Marinimicrobia bacterium]|nr:HigA family addiction module antidote protein [Candidatus Neomarinimicrobiota bacterium]